MKILYDYQIFQSQKFGGISKYFTEILAHFPKKIRYDIAVATSDNKHLLTTLPSVLNSKPLVTRELFFKKNNFRGKWRLYELLKQKFPNNYNEYKSVNRDYSIHKLKKQKFDIFHPTYYDPYFLEFIGEKPFVLTVHDMIHEKFQHLFTTDPTAAPTIEFKKKLIHKATHIIAVSENTKKDIIELMGVDESKISVIYHASSLIKNTDSELQLPPNYILYVGNRYLYKNFILFIQAIKNVLKKNSLKLVCVGSVFNEQEKKLIYELELNEHCIQLLAEDIDMYDIYANAVCFVFPSLYEGFGIPILEAFDAGCPVLLSNTSCFPEIAKEAALYFNPYDKEDIATTVKQLIGNEGLRNSLINKGKERLQFFSWQQSAKQTAEVYKKMLV